MNPFEWNGTLTYQRGKRKACRGYGRLLVVEAMPMVLEYIYKHFVIMSSLSNNRGGSLDH